MSARSRRGVLPDERLSLLRSRRRRRSIKLRQIPLFPLAGHDSRANFGRSFIVGPADGEINAEAQFDAALARGALGQGDESGAVNLAQIDEARQAGLGGPAIVS